MHDLGTVRPQWRRTRWIAVPLVAAMAATLLAGAAAAGATTTPQAKPVSAPRQGPVATVDSVEVTGTAAEGPFSGTFELQRFRSRHGVLYAVGRLEGTLAGRDIHKNVSWPVSGAQSNPAPQPTGFGIRSQPTPTPGACSLLTLNLGPLDLDLLGLRVALDPVNLLIEAIPGAGNLVGNLLCAVAGLLDPGALPGGLGGLLQGLLDAISNLLNGLLGL